MSQSSTGLLFVSEESSRVHPFVCCGSETFQESFFVASLSCSRHRVQAPTHLRSSLDVRSLLASCLASSCISRHICSELAGQKRSRPSSESGPHEELERTSVLPRISSEDRLQGGSSLDKPSRELPYETGRAALVTGRAARAFPEDLNLNLPGDEFPQQQGTPPPQREYEFWPRPENLQQEYGFRDRLQQQDLGYLVPQDRHAPLDRNAQEQEVGSAAQQDLATAFARETLDAGGGDARSDRDTGEGDARRTRPGDSKKESLDLDLNSAPLKWL
jgi:hypothetical protein